MKIAITGGTGFIGSALIRYLITETEHSVVNIDKLTYAAQPASLATVEDDARYCFEQHDICDGQQLKRIFQQHQIDALIHLAAESHVDRSISAPAEFIQSNIVGTYNLLEVSREHWQAGNKPGFRFLHVSTDEVYGSLDGTGAFSENTALQPNSPYSASKAAADHLLRAWQMTYKLPVLITRCSNNYGPYQYPEKLIPLVIFNALAAQRLPVYGDGQQIRDWIYVDDHVQALYQVLLHGQLGETYNIGGNCQLSNLQMVTKICALLDEMVTTPVAGITRFSDLISFVTDRAGHDRHYAMDISKIQRELNWSPGTSLESGLRRTVAWYLANKPVSNHW